MWIKKLAHGVLELDTPIGPRYLEPSFWQRVWLLWIFRNFFSLPHVVLRPRERQLMDRLCAENRFMSLAAFGVQDRPVIGRVERRPIVAAAVLPMRRPVASSRPAVGEQGSEAISA